ncbi:MAG: hypothetical protein ACKN9V_05345 [Pseudomonadota bacterium]
MLTTKYIQIALLFFALLCMADKGWGSFKPASGQHSQATDKDNCEPPKVPNGSDCLDPESASLADLGKIENLADLPEETKTKIEENLAKILFGDPDVDAQTMDEGFRILTEMNKKKEKEVENPPTSGLLNMPSGGMPDVPSQELRRLQVVPLTPNTAQQTGVGMGQVTPPVYGPPLPPPNSPYQKYPNSFGNPSPSELSGGGGGPSISSDLCPSCSRVLSPTASPPTGSSRNLSSDTQSIPLPAPGDIGGTSTRSSGGSSSTKRSSSATTGHAAGNSGTTTGTTGTTGAMVDSNRAPSSLEGPSSPIFSVPGNTLAAGSNASSSPPPPPPPTTREKETPATREATAPAAKLPPAVSAPQGFISVAEVGKPATGIPSATTTTTPAVAVNDGTTGDSRRRTTTEGTGTPPALRSYASNDSLIIKPSGPNDAPKKSEASPSTDSLPEFSPSKVINPAVGEKPTSTKPNKVSVPRLGNASDLLDVADEITEKTSGTVNNSKISKPEITTRAQPVSKEETFAADPTKFRLPNLNVRPLGRGLEEFMRDVARADAAPPEGLTTNTTTPVQASVRPSRTVIPTRGLATNPGNLEKLGAQLDAQVRKVERTVKTWAKGFLNSFLWK